MDKATFSWKFIETIGEWQNYGAGVKRVLNNLLKLEIPNKYKICNGPIYRVLGINKNARDIESHIGSWSLSTNIAKDFIQSDWFMNLNWEEEKEIVLIKVGKPNPDNIIVNLHLLWQDKGFLQSIKQFESFRKFFNEGLEFGDSQKEVVYKSKKISKKDIELIWNKDKNKWEKAV